MRIHAKEISHKGPREVGAFSGTAADTADIVANLSRFGINFDSRHVDAMIAAHRSGVVPMMGMDAALTPALTTPSIATPLQFLQEWLPGFVFVVTAARKIDDLIGITTQGRWEDAEVVQGIMERTGNTAVYGDFTNIPLSSWNTNFETRSVVRFEEGMSVGRLEEATAAAMRVNSAESKRSAAAEALEITRNFVGFFGYNNGVNRTFGFLNDPQLPAYVTVAVGASAATEWNTKTFLEITGDIRSWFQALRSQSGDRIDPGKEAVTLALATDVYDSLSVTSVYGNSVLKWLEDTYPNTRVVSAPELNAADGGENVAYLYAEGVVDESTDDKRTWVQVVPAKFQTLGVEQRAKAYVEDYSNATAGALLKRPWAVYRASGI